jgi:predicted nucleic acid-binding protein
LSNVLVVDSSAILSLCFEDEDNTYGQRVLDRVEAGASILVPAVWPLEIGNGLVMAERRGRLKPDALARFLLLLKDLVIALDQRSLADTVQTTLPLARQHGLTVYDAAYLELAIRESAPLATLDQKLADACRAAGGTVM